MCLNIIEYVFIVCLSDMRITLCTRNIKLHFFKKSVYNWIKYERRKAMWEMFDMWWTIKLFYQQASLFCFNAVYRIPFNYNT